MEQSEILIVFSQTIMMILKLSAPILLISILVGLLVSIFQAATQINEQTLTFVPKVITIAFVLIITGSWMITNLVDFFHYLMRIMVGL